MEQVYQTKYDCCGCGLCAQKCPKQAIKMQANEHGFLYPVISEELCIDCGLCAKACAFTHTAPLHIVQDSYIAKNTSEKTLKESTSGGIFSACADAILSEGGVIYAAGFGDDMRVTLQKAESQVEYAPMRGSKYVQCDMTNAFSSVLKDLKDDRSILFVGTPCMVSAIKKATDEKSQKRLFTCDLLCNGVSSPLVWSLFVKQLEKKYKKRVKHYYFRTKTAGYLSKDEIVVFEDGSRRILTASIEKYNTEIYYSRLAMRPSCSKCPFTDQSRVGDLTIGDCGHALSKYPSFDGKKGASLLLVNTRQGQELLARTDLIKQNVPLETLISVRMQKPVEEHADAESFIAIASKNGLKKALIHRHGRLKWIKLSLYFSFKKTLNKICKKEISS